MAILYWFKNDLRLHDNEALYRAVELGKKLLLCYCIDPKNYRQLDLGFRKSDKVRHQFLLQCLADLRSRLQRMGGNLLVVSGNPAIEITKLVNELKITDIYAEEEYAEEESELVEGVKNALPDFCQLNPFWGRTLYHKDDIPYAIDEIPLISKTYRIKTTKETEVRACFPAVKEIDFLKIADYGEIPDLESVVQENNKSEEIEPFVKGGETKALERLQHYFFETEQLTAYKWTRNRSLGMDYSSKFSPYLALGCLSPRYVYHEVKRYEEKTKKNYGTWWFVFELVWRDFFIFRHMRVGPKLYTKNGFKGKKVEFDNSKILFDRWCAGKTGIPFIDAHMRQLSQTGYMSNRGRVNCASFLIHDYKVDWRWGAAYFESKLIDYDVSVNWMNWHMQAFEIWYTNPVHQANKYNAQEYIRNWLPELAHLDNIAILIPWESDIESYPKPLEIYQKWQRSINTINKKKLKETAK
ncbi:DASH family cryptochrome [Costertonia aggregata]|uniref:Cryptochrome DASH n=1 Tax=Costertonia aggregata TaxID=343403 RepID=A0A7H9AT23_9FLAO|nr:DASH family cryptochrome [Costertonia aggregata]QLG46492.1 DASH family cryptochrome [Costertonia aggregata]